jgi:hypothetical protein
MNKTPRTKKLTLRTRQARCSHPATIELMDGARVCTACEAVLAIAA